MARGWGRSEEDLEADREQARTERGSPRGTRRDAALESERGALKLSLARIEEQLARTTSPARRKALEAARADLAQRLRECSPDTR
jgi:hypothetical protein